MEQQRGHPGKDPLVLADKPFGEWNTFRIIQVGARTTVYLNDKLVVDHATSENYFDKQHKLPLYATGPIQLQTHGGEIRWRNVYVREIPADEANEILGKHNDTSFETVFNGKDFDGWEGDLDNYDVVDGAIRCKAGKGGNLFTKAEYGDFAVRLEFKLPPGGNNGLAIRYPGKGHVAYDAMCELQVLDSEHPKYAKLDPRQYHGSVYGMVPAVRGYLRPVGQWNFEEVTVKGSTIKVELNGSRDPRRRRQPGERFHGQFTASGQRPEVGAFRLRRAQRPGRISRRSHQATVANSPNRTQLAAPLAGALSGATIREVCPASWYTALRATTEFLGGSIVSGSPVLGFGS